MGECLNAFSIMLGETEGNSKISVLLNKYTYAADAKSLQSCPTLSDPMDCGLPGFSIHGILQASVLEWGAIDFSKKVNEESEKVGLKLNIQKTKIMASSPITSWQIDGETVETVSDFILGGLQNHCRWWLQPWN